MASSSFLHIFLAPHTTHVTIHSPLFNTFIKLSLDGGGGGGGCNVYHGIKLITNTANAPLSHCMGSPLNLQTTRKSEQKSRTVNRNAGSALFVTPFSESERHGDAGGGGGNGGKARERCAFP